MKLDNLESLYNQYGRKSSGALAPDDQYILKEGLDNIKAIKNETEAKKFLQLLALLRKSEVKSIEGLGVSAMETITGAFAGGDEGVYAADTDLMNARFIFELVQNVDDCSYKTVDNCTLEIQFDIAANVIRLEYNELGFQPENVMAITGLGNSTKNHSKARNIKSEKKIDQSDLQEIGEKGIGFKSIFGLAKRVKITSQYFCFTIDRDSFFVPVVDDYTNITYTDGTVLELTLDEGMVEELFDFLQRKYDNVEAIINENPILFLNKLTEIKYCKSQEEYFGFRVSRSNTIGEYTEENTIIEYFSSNTWKNKKIEAYRFSHTIEYSIEECQSRYGEQETSTRKHKIIVIAPKNEGMIKRGRIYSFFATAEEIYAPFIIHAPFKLNSGRTRIDSQSQSMVSKNKWFLKTQRETIDMIHRVYEKLAEYQGNKICFYIPAYSLVTSGCALACKEIEKSTILGWNIFEDVDGNHRPVNEVCMIDFSGDLEELIKIHEILGLKKHLLKIKSEQRHLYKDFSIEETGNIEERLFICALLDREKTTACLKYITDYQPKYDISESKLGSDLELYYDQLIEFSKLKKICAWINRNTFNGITPGKKGRRIRVICTESPQNVDVIKNFCEEFWDAINKQFVAYLKRVNYYNVNFENTIYLYDAVFGKNVMEDFAEMYRVLTPKDKFFYAFLQMEAISEKIDILCKCDDEISDYDFLTSLKKYRAMQKNMLKEQYQSILDVIEKSGTGTERFFPEILQNIDDCIYKSTPGAIFRSEKINDIYKLYVEYNEVGFSREQIRAITAIGDSTKKKLLSADMTGEKGVGFKSIFALCESVMIKSGYFSFKLSAKTPTIPENITEIEYHNGTKMVFELKPREAGSVIGLLSDEQRLVKNCLCLKQLHSLYINQKELRISDQEGRRVVKYGDNKQEYFLYVYPIEIDNYLAMHQREKTRKVFRKQKIEYLVPLGKERNEEYDYCDYCVYSTFPTQEKVNIPMIVNMPLELDTARERIQDGEWNRELIQHMMEGLLFVYDKLKYIEKEKLPLFFPEDGKVLFHKYGQSGMLLRKIADSDVFKLALKDEYVSLKTGIFSCEFEYMLFNKYGEKISGDLQNRLLKKDNKCFEWLKRLYKYEIEERNFGEICEVIDSLLAVTKNQKEEFITDEAFRKELYEFLAFFGDSDNIKEQAELIKKWKIIPVKVQKKVKYECFSEEMYAPGEENIDSEKYKILAEDILPIERFNKIYSHITGEYKPLQRFTKDIVISEFFNEVRDILEKSDPENSAKKIWSLYKKEKDLFEKTYETKKDFPVEKMYFITRTGTVLGKEKCYIWDDQERQGCLDKIIVAKEYEALAKLVGVNSISGISSYKQIDFEIGRKELAELSNNKNLSEKSKLFGSLYMYEGRDVSLKDGMGFFELYVVTPREVRNDKRQKQKQITITEDVLRNYSNEINEISTGGVPIDFIIEFELQEFVKDNVLAEIEDELQVRKETETLNIIMEMLDNCYYALMRRKEPCCIRTKDRRILLIHVNTTADFDIIEVLKAYFLKYFNTELSINRSIRLYSRRGFENISTIESSEEDVAAAVSMMAGINITNVEEVKDFICRPLLLKGKTYGGYAKTCPLCNARIDTELTGMRIYKTKCEGMIIPLISCSNCHENLKYSSSVNVNMEKLKRGLLELECVINGFEWHIQDKVIRLGHRALIKKMNSR